MKNKKNIVIAIIVIAVVALIGWNGFNPGIKANNQEIVIGAVLSETGMASIDGNNIKSGIEFAKEELAKKGVKVKVIYEDDQTNPKNTVTAIQKLVDVNHPQAIIGPTWSFLADAAGPVVEKNKIVALTPSNTSEYVNPQTDYMFFGAPKNETKNIETTKWIKERGLKKIAIVIEKS